MAQRYSANGEGYGMCAFCSQHWTDHNWINSKYYCKEQPVLERKEQPTPVELIESVATKPDTATVRNSGFDARGKKMRIVFKKGRDLNIFNVQSLNFDGSWWRITDGEGRLFVVDPAKVNYTETK